MTSTSKATLIVLTLACLAAFFVPSIMSTRTTGNNGRGLRGDNIVPPAGDDDAFLVKPTPEPSSSKSSHLTVPEPRGPSSLAGSGASLSGGQKARTYIVTVKDDGSMTESQQQEKSDYLKELVKSRYGAKITHTYETLFHGFAYTVPVNDGVAEQSFEFFQNDETVDIEEDQAMRIFK